MNTRRINSTRVNGMRLAELLATERRYQALVEKGLYVRKWTWVSSYSVHYQDGREIGHGKTPEEAIDAALLKREGK